MGSIGILLLNTITKFAQSRMMGCTGHVESVEDIRMHRAFYGKFFAKEKMNRMILG
jgi:hypothetical protein